MKNILSNPIHIASENVPCEVEKELTISALEKKLEEVTLKFELLTKSTNEAIRDCDLQTNLITWNHGLSALFGYSDKITEIPYEFWAENIHPEDKQEVLSEIIDALHNRNQNWSAIYRFKCTSGSYKYIYDRVYIIYDASKPIRMIGTMQDIDERMTTLAEIERLSLVASKTDNLVIIADAEERIEWVNDAFTKRTGYALQEVIGKTIGFLHGPETAKETLDRISISMRSRKSTTEEVLYFTKEGIKFWVKININPVIDDSQNLNRWVMVQTDISVHKEYERKIIAIAHELSNLIENANAVIFGVDKNLKVNEWNKCAHLATGYAKSNVVGKRISEFLFDTPQRDELESLLNTVLTGELLSLHEFPIVNQNGELEILLISATPRRNAAGEIIGLIAVGQDITELTQYRYSLEEKVRLRTKELNAALIKEKELSTMKTRFASIVSHEFRTPLASISLAANLVKRYKDRLSPEAVDEKINLILKQVDNMSHLLEDVLTIGKTQDSGIKVNQSRVDLLQFFKGLTEQVESVNNNTHTIESSFVLGINELTTDEGLLRNIFVNLLGNAIKFSPGKSIVYLKVYEGKDKVLFEIKDEGIGIPSSDLERVFEPFDRGSNTGAISGTGLGLSIVKKAIDLLAGSISLNSESGKGSVFTVTIPRHK